MTGGHVFPRRFTFVAEVPAGYENAKWAVNPDGSVTFVHPDLPSVTVQPRKVER